MASHEPCAFCHQVLQKNWVETTGSSGMWKPDRILMNVENADFFKDSRLRSVAVHKENLE